jgi:ribosomal protein S18 acetylase RimI-like enzyme
MQQIGSINTYTVIALTQEIAENYTKEISELASQIPKVDYTEADILAESKGERIFYGKWEHSLIVFCGGSPIAVLIAYERKGEGTEQYPVNSIYISELAVQVDYQKQGIARGLLRIFLDHSKNFKFLEGDLIFTVQTNCADWNKHVCKLYESFGFQSVANKKYENREDFILSKMS